MQSNSKPTFHSIMLSLTYIYLSLPICIFMIGWLKPLFSIPFVFIVIVCLVRICWNTFRDKDSNTEIILSPALIMKCVLACLIIIIWVSLSGIGGLSFQTSDHNYRNTIFELLVHHEWPVRFELVTANGSSHRDLVYYIGFWMPSAVIGKLFGLNAGYLFQVLWACLGIVIVYYLICRYFKNIRLWYLIIFIFFSGLDVIGATLLNHGIPYYIYYDGQNIYSPLSSTHLEWWCEFQFSSMTTQLFWVFNQAIPAWVATILLMQQRSSRYYIYILGCLLLCSPFPFVGLLPFVLYWVIRHKQEVFSFENIVGGGITGIITFLYLRSNDSSQIHDTSTATFTSPIKYVILVILFIAIEVGIYYFLIFKYEKRNPIYYISFIWLSICPLITVGSGQDFCMRASVPALIILYTMIIRTLIDATKKRSHIFCALLCTILLIGAITPLHEVYRSIHHTIEFHMSGTDIMSDSVAEEEVMTAENFSGVRSHNVIYILLFK